MKISIDSKVILLDDQLIKHIGFISNAIELSDIVQEEITIPNVPGIHKPNVTTYDNLQTIVRILNNVHDIHIERPLKTTFEACVNEETARLLQMDEKDLVDLFNLVNFLNITPVSDVFAAKLSTICKHKTTQEIRVLFNLVNDFTPEEEAKNEELCKWMTIV